MERSMALTFYYGSGSPYAWRVWLALEHKQIPYEFRLLSFDKNEHKTPEFLAVNPRGQVPALKHDGFALWESVAMLDYLEDAFPAKPLLPGDAKGRATVRRMVAEADNYLYAAQLDLFKETLFRGDRPVDPPAIEKAKQKSLDELARFDSMLAGDFFAGALSFADFTIYPIVRMYQRIEERQPGGGIARDRLPKRIAAWAQRIEALPYCEKTLPPHWKK
jgi:glutathione S-transferase